MRLLPFLLCSLALAGFALAQRLSPLAPPPVWAELDPYQETITQKEFLRLLNEVYAPANAGKDFFTVEADSVSIKTTLTPPAVYILRFAKAGAEKPVSRFWRPAAAQPQPLADQDKPLAGVKIAIDPGHLGGTWAQMEERFYQIGESKPVAEGDLTLRVAALLAPRLEAIGATVLPVRVAPSPVTPQRPSDLRDTARAELATAGHPNPPEAYQGPDDPQRTGSVQLESEFLFYRTSEIRARAQLVNEKLRPDLTLCLHFNAEAWGDPIHPEFVPRNHLHVLLNGCYSAAELRNDDVRHDMLIKLLDRSYAEERAAGESIAAAMAQATGLPAYKYTTGNAIAVGESGYLWARNLLANRLYRTPVVFIEPYVMNSEVVWERVQAGDYEGEIVLGGVSRKSIFREYADAVAEGLRAYYSQARPPR